MELLEKLTQIQAGIWRRPGRSAESAAERPISGQVRFLILSGSNAFRPQRFSEQIAATG